MVRAIWMKVWGTFITETYAELGILNETLFILTGDNGGMPSAGGNN